LSKSYYSLTTLVGSLGPSKFAQMSGHLVGLQLHKMENVARVVMDSRFSKDVVVCLKKTVVHLTEVLWLVDSNVKPARGFIWGDGSQQD